MRTADHRAEKKQRNLHQVRVDERIGVRQGELRVALRDEHPHKSGPAFRGFSIIPGNQGLEELVEEPINGLAVCIGLRWRRVIQDATAQVPVEEDARLRMDSRIALDW